MSKKRIAPEDALVCSRSRLFSRCVIRIEYNRWWVGRIVAYTAKSYTDDFMVARLTYSAHGEESFELETLNWNEALEHVRYLFGNYPNSPINFDEAQLALEYKAPRSDPKSGRRQAYEISEGNWKVFQGWILLRTRLGEIAPQVELDKICDLRRRIQAKVLDMNEKFMTIERMKGILTSASI